MIKIRENELLKNYTTLHIGGLCKTIYFPSNEDEVREVLKLNPIILGCGSNVLINDRKTYDHAMVLTEFNRIVLDEDKIIAEAGAKLMDVCLFACQHGLTGMEFAYGIPGSVGGAIVMNAGAYGGEMKDVAVQVKTDKRIYNHNECQFSYRHSVFSEANECVLSVTFQLEKGDPVLIQHKMEELLRRRIEKQPVYEHSAGSTFKRGTDFYASQLISECGLKGVSIKDACVSKKHAGFLINKGNAAYEDFQKLIETVQKTVYDKTGKKLECEVRRID